MFVATYGRLDLSTSNMDELDLPIERVDIKHFRDPHERCQVVEPIIYKQEKPEVDPNSGFSVTWCPMSKNV